MEEEKRTHTGPVSHNATHPPDRHTRSLYPELTDGGPEPMSSLPPTSHLGPLLLAPGSFQACHKQGCRMQTPFLLC